MLRMIARYYIRICPLTQKTASRLPERKRKGMKRSFWERGGGGGGSRRAERLGKTGSIGLG